MTLDGTRLHRERVRHVRLEWLRAAEELEQEAIALGTVADHWRATGSAAANDADYRDRLLHVAGCADLTPLGAISTSGGVLFMEGELDREPREVARMRATVGRLQRRCGAWVAGLEEPASAAGHLRGAEALLDAAREALGATDFRPAALRERDPLEAAADVDRIAGLLDRAAGKLGTAVGTGAES